MAERTTEDGISASQIEETYEVLEVIRENLSKDNMTNMSEIVNEAHYLVQQYDEGANWVNDYDLPEVGDVLYDKDNNSRYGDGEVRVTEVLPDSEARTHYIDTDTGKRSVAWLNRQYDENAPIVKAKYVTGSDKEYAFPSTRLE